MKHLDLDLRQFSYLFALVERDFQDCLCCRRRSCGLTKEQCESFKKVKIEVLDIFNNA